MISPKHSRRFDFKNASVWQADALQNRADALLARAENIDTLVDETQHDLAKKREDFEHYKNRAQTEMAISLQVAALPLSDLCCGVVPYNFAAFDLVWLTLVPFVTFIYVAFACSLQPACRTAPIRSLCLYPRTARDWFQPGTGFRNKRPARMTDV